METVEKNTSELIQFFNKTLNEIKDIGTEQFPLIAQEIINAGILGESVSIISSILFFCVSSIVMYTICKMEKFHDGLAACMILCIVTFAISSISLVSNTIDLLHIIVAPKLYIIEELTKMISKLN